MQGSGALFSTGRGNHTLNPPTESSQKTYSGPLFSTGRVDPPTDSSKNNYSEKNSKRCGQYIMSMYADGPEKKSQKNHSNVQKKKGKNIQIL